MTRHSRTLILFTALSWIASVAADVTLSLPLVSQLPPIARSGQPYAFTISHDTFQFEIPHGSAAPPSPPTLLYAAEGVPSWLSFDATTLTFSGTVPANANVGKHFRVSVTASLPKNTAGLGGGNTTATDSFGVLVLNEPAPTVKIPITQQLTTASSLGAAYMAAPDAIHLPLGWSFSIGLSGDTFAISTGADVFWSVSLVGGAPLPDWLHYSPDSYDFYGVAPVDVTDGADEYDVVVTGSNRPGYGGVSQTFRLIVGSQTLSLPQGLPSINGSIGRFLSQQITTSGLVMSGARQTALNNVTVTAEVPVSALGWLAFDPTNRTFTGVPPYVPYGNASSTSEVDVPVTFANGGGAQLTVNQTIRIPPSAFTALELPNIAINDGAYVSISVGQFLRNATLPGSSKRSKSASRRATSVYARAPAAVPSSRNVTVATDPADASMWLSYDSTTRMLAGQVPSDWTQRVHVMLTSAASQASFYLTFDGETSDPSGNNGSGHGPNGGGSTLSPHTRIALGASLGIAAALLALIAAVCCCFRRRRDPSDDPDRSREKYAAQRDEDEGTLTDHADRQRKWKKAIVIGRNGVGEVGTPSTIAVSPMAGFGFDEQNKKGKMASPQGAAANLHSVVVVSPNGGRRDATHEVETPMQSRLITNLFGGGRARRATSATAPPLSAGLGLSLMGDGNEKVDDPFAGPPLDSRGRIRHQRSRESVRSHRSSWESDLFYEDAPSSQQQHQRTAAASSEATTAVNDGGESEDVPRRRGKPAATGLNVRHRATHNNQSPAFNAPDVFVAHPNAASAALSNSSRGLDQIGMSAVNSGLTESDDSQHGYALSGQEDDVRVLKARVMQVQRHSPVLHQGVNNPFAPSSARAEQSTQRGDVTSGGAFDDAVEEDDEGEWLAGDNYQVSRGHAVVAAKNKRTSTMSAMTDTSHFAGIRAHYAVEAAHENAAAAGRVPPSGSFMDGISISGIEPHDSVKPVIVRSQTPPPPPAQGQSSAHGTTPQTPKTPSKRLSTTGAASGRFLPCPTVPATMGHLLRFHLYPSVPPPMAGAMGSPGKRSGRTVRYELVMLDERAHLQKYRGQWPAMLSDWLSLDATTFEVEGIVPRAAELEQLRDCEIALVSTTRISGNPNSPDRAEGKRSSVSSLSYDSTGAAVPPAMVSNDEERTVVARCKLVFQNAAPRPFFPPRKGHAF